MEDRRAQVAHARNSASDAPRCDRETRYALGVAKRKTATRSEVVRCPSERPTKTRRTTPPSVTSDEERDRNSSLINDKLDEEVTLSPELKELARIVGSHAEDGLEWDMDWQCIYQEASPELKALIDCNTKETSLKQNCRKNAAMFKSDPRYCLIGLDNQMRFKSYSEKLTSSLKGPDTGEVIEVIKEVPLVNPQRHRKQWTSVLESRVSDMPAPSPVKTPSCVPTSRAHCGNADRGDAPCDGNEIAPDRKNPSGCDASVEASKLSHDVPGDKDFGLPVELLELVRIVESQSIEGKGTRWDWDYIQSQASQTLRHFIASKRMKSGLSRRSIVGEAMLPSFESFHARVRQQRLVRDIANASREEPKEKKHCPAKDGKPKTVQAHRGNDRQGVTEASERSPCLHTLTGVSTAVNVANQAKHLTIELRELAALIAKSTGHSWAYIESKASPRLKSFIDEKARGDPAYISAPLRCLVPSEYFDDFETLAEQCKVDGRADLACSDAGSGHDVKHKQGNRKDRKLGQVFALERKSRIKALTSNLRAELRAFEAQEVPLWDSFLRGNHREE